MEKESVTELKPPYVTYGTFRNLITSFREGVLPNRIDRSVMPGTANGVQTYLLSALRFFGLTDDKGVPTPDFKILADKTVADGTWKTEWKRVVERSYDFIFASGIDLQRATESQLHEKFREKGLDGATLRKCHTFFTHAVEAAGIVLGPHAKSSTKGPGSGNRSGATRKKRTVAPDSTKGGAPQSGTTSSGNGSGNSSPRTMQEMILAKFPEFDPTWPNEIKTAWFKDFSELRKWGEPA